MLTKQDFEKMFEDVLDGFASNKFIGGPFESQGADILESAENPFYFFISDVKTRAEEFYNYLNTLDKVNPNSRELFGKFADFAKSYRNLLIGVEEYYDNPENPKPKGERKTFDVETLFTKGSGFLGDFYVNAEDPNVLRGDVLPKFINKFCETTGLEVVQPKAKQQKQPKQAVNQNAEPKAAPAADPEECANFKKLATILEKAKTLKNSQEYKSLITMCKALGDPETVAKMGKNGRKEMLAATGKKINDYISHKAKDGVKPNVFKKFAAVEALSKYLDTKLEPYKNEVIDVGENMNVDVSKLNLDFDKYRQSVPDGKVILAESYTCPVQYFANIDPRQGVVQNNMHLATNLLRKVSFEYEMINSNNKEVEVSITSAAQMFSDPRFAEAELSGKNMDIEANKKNDGPQNVL